ncbi:hypothetical protein [Flavobacterium sp. '19STA2R22 D10 B1']|uniref:hypothetical protein n=1 Tax=Flavobacterium aerium TaxID=3037261 RepID=UPI00278C0BE6|nr:hypothetical protein [Flavobacterium sp. '19STA2R22 D10 B1']
MNKKLFSLCLMFGGLSTYAQVGVGTPLPDSRAQLDVVASDRGVLIPRVQLKSIKRMDPITNNGSLPNSLLVFNEATAGVAPENVIPGYYYWYDNRWNRVLISGEVASSASGGGNVVYNPITNLFTYINSSGNPQEISFHDIVVANETLTTLVNNGSGTYVYTSENNTATTIDVVGDVVSNISTILNNPSFVTELTQVIKNNETLTSLAYDPTANALIYTDENGVANPLNLVDVVGNSETLTSLTYNLTANALTYTDENGLATVINLHSSVDGEPQIITTLVNNGSGTYTYNTVTTIDVAGDVVNNATTILNNPAYLTELTNIIKNNQTLTSLVYNQGANTLTYKDEKEESHVLNLVDLIGNA